MLRFYCFVFALVISNLTTYFFIHESKNITSKDEINDTFSVLKPKDNYDSKIFEVTENDFQDHTYAAYDLAYVGNAILALRPSSVRESLLSVLVAGWFETDHVGLAEWLNQQPGEIDVDSAIVVFSRLASRVDPEASIEWAASVSNKYLQEQTIQNVAKQFRSNYPRQFHEYMSNGGVGPKLIASTGFAAIPSPVTETSDKEKAFRMDIIEEESEPIESILARRVRLAGSSSRVNNVKLDQD